MSEKLPNHSSTGTRFSVGTGITAGAQAISLIVGLGTSVILARVLGPEGKGSYTLAMLLPSLIVTFGNLGIGPATVYYVTRNAKRNTRRSATNQENNAATIAPVIPALNPSSASATNPRKRAD